MAETLSEQKKPRPVATRTLGGGANQAGARAYNERLMLALIRRNGPLAKAELARLSGLSAQTLSIIMRRLDADGLVTPQEPLRGRIGQPSVPYALNPLGAMSYGLKIGRRSTDLVLCDFLGEVRGRAKLTYAFPVTGDVFAFVQRQTNVLTKRFGNKAPVIGMGVAMPFDLWKWAEQMSAPASVLEGWRDLDVARELTHRTGLPVEIANDATAACVAELARSERTAQPDFLYFFIGSFIGGGVVLNGSVYQGRTGNAGALGSIPITSGRRTTQLIESASLITLEKMLLADHIDAGLLQSPDADWSPLGSLLDTWIERTAASLAMAIVAAVSVIDFAQICIDGAVPTAVRSAIVDATRRSITRRDLQGLSPFEINAGTIGAEARALGGALLPIQSNYSSDRDVLLKALQPA
jgi:predicted NBD/HSP70 family sugar kinase